jgi:UDP-N-acetylglucosamine 2-epimerase (non-hydrolysing)
MILAIAGTRPELVKLAPVVTLARQRGLAVHVHCTMQSPDLVDRDILAWDSSGPWLCADDFAGLGIIAEIVVVQGDTRTAFEAAVTAYEHALPIFHLEAGVRTYNPISPWPEEGYRQMISRIATYHACTTARCMTNLINEGLGRQAIRQTGSPVVDSIRQRVAALQTAPVSASKQILLTLHRRENRRHFSAILSAVAGYAFLHEMSVLWPTHPNGWALGACGNDVRGAFTIVPPLSPTAFAQAMLDSAFVVTDSGGVQEECNALGIPCAVMRDQTDRPESVGAGGAFLPSQLWGVSPFSVLGITHATDRAAINRDVFGDGTASEQIVDWWQDILKEGA